jgi:hypothetical protein
MSINLSRTPFAPKCRHCGSDLTLKLVNLGVSPIANDFVDLENYMKAEAFYPLAERSARGKNYPITLLESC